MTLTRLLRTIGYIAVGILLGLLLFYIVALMVMWATFIGGEP